MGSRERSPCCEFDHVKRDAYARLDTQKKTPVATEQNRPDVVAKRATFLEQQPQLDARKLVFVDESGFRLGSPPRHGWAPRGVDSPGYGVHGKWQTVTMIGAIAHDGFRGFMTINAGTSTDVFRAFVEQQLVPNLSPGETVVMDNLSAHKNSSISRAIEAAGCEVLFTPPYSPEFNPIEETWAKLKDILRRLDTNTRVAFDHSVAVAMDCIQRADIRGWFNYAGYRLSSG